MHVLSLPTLLLTLPLLTSAASPPASWNEIRPSGNIIVLDNSPGLPYPPDSTAEYMKCTPNPFADEAHICDGKQVTQAQCMESCKARKRAGQSAEFWCEKWSGCKGSTMDTYCRCNVGYWFPDKFPGKSPPTKNVKLAEPMK